MSEPNVESAGSDGLVSVVTAGGGPGALLRNAREAQGLSIAALAVALKVPVKKLEALESDRFDLLPDTVFARAFALSVCRTLKLDPTNVMARLPQLQTLQIRTDESGLNATFKSNVGGLNGTRIMQILSPAVIVALGLVVAIVVVYFWPTKPMVEDAAMAGSNVLHEQVPTVSQTVASGGSEVTKPLSVEPVEPFKLTDSPALGASVANAATSTSPHVSGSSSPTMTLSPQSILTLQARGASWVEVTDAQGATQLRKTVSEGELIPISGVLPLSVVVGRANMVSVSVRGQAFDLAAVSKDNIARFEVK